MTDVGKQKDLPKFVSIKRASLLTGIGAQTLRKLANEKKIACYKTPAGQRRFDLSYLQKMSTTFVSQLEETTPSKQNFLYARVSSRKQMDDLARQIESLKQWKSEYATFTLIQDVASGINFQRKGLQTILESCLSKTIGTVVVAHRDRLARFAFDLLQSIITKAGGNVVVVDDQRAKSSEQELAEDLLSIVQIYTCKQMGKRRYSRKNGDQPDNQIVAHEGPKVDPQ